MSRKADYWNSPEYFWPFGDARDMRPATYEDELKRGNIEPRRVTPSPPRSPSSSSSPTPPPSPSPEAGPADSPRLRSRSPIRRRLSRRERRMRYAQERIPTPPIPDEYDEFDNLDDFVKIKRKQEDIQHDIKNLEMEFERDRREVSAWNNKHPNDERPYPSERRLKQKLEELELKLLKLEAEDDAHHRMSMKFRDEIKSGVRVPRPRRRRSRSRSRSPVLDPFTIELIKEKLGEYENNYKELDRVRLGDRFLDCKVLYSQYEITEKPKLNIPKHIVYVYFSEHYFSLDFEAEYIYNDSDLNKFTQCKLRLPGIQNMVYFVRSDEKNKHLIEQMLTIAYDNNHRNFNKYALQRLSDYRYSITSLKEMYKYKISSL